MPAISPRRRSSGAATVAAITEGSAPGRVALTRIEGKSTLGTDATGRNSYATTPIRNSPIESSVVPTGRRMNGSEIDAIIVSLLSLHTLGRASDRRLRRVRSDRRQRPLQPPVHAVKRKIDHRRRVERQQLAEQQAADDRYSQRKAQLGAGATFDRERQRTEKRRKRRHHDRAETQ